MLQIEEIEKKMEEYQYWDSRILNIQISNFAHEVTLIHEDDEGDAIYKFSRCYKVDFHHDLSYPKEKFLDYSHLERGQKPYFIHNIDLSVINQNNTEFYKTVLEAYPMTLTIISEELSVYKEDK